MSGPRTYLDHNASAPLRAEARAALLATLELCGNPSSVHAEGRKARAVIETAREQVAALLNASPSEVVFTSGATEANNAVLAAGWDSVIYSGLEHESVLARARSSPARLIEIPARSDGVAAIEVIAEHVLKGGPRLGRTLVTLQMANNETGVLQPVAETAAFAHTHGLHVHTDAVQAAGRVAVDFHAIGCDTMAISSHKIGGPKGVGALIISEGCALPPFIRGGGQERRRRAGTESVAAIAGFGAAAEAGARGLANIRRVQALRDILERLVLRLSPEAAVIGQDAPRIPNTSCIAWPGRHAETLVIKMDLAGVAISAGSACSSGKVGPSHVLAAMGLSPEISGSAIRVSLGPETEARDINAFLKCWLAIRGPSETDETVWGDLTESVRAMLDTPVGEH